MPARPVEAVAVAVAVLHGFPLGAIAGTCDYPLPAANTTVGAYVRQLQGHPKGGLAQELGEALNDLVEWMPTSCGAVQPEVTHKNFLIRHASADGGNCRSFHMTIMPPSAQSGLEETPVSCSPASDGSANGWVCFFRK